MTQTEVDQRPLTEYLLSEVNRGLSGMDDQELVDFSPSRSIFAGVLQPARDHQQADSPQSGGSAIGLDFRIRLTKDTKPLCLALKASWAHYYAVFPTWQQVVSTGQVSDAVRPAVRQAAADTATKISEGDEPGSILPAEQDRQVESEQSDDVADVEGADDVAKQKEAGRVVLPRAFARIDAHVPWQQVVMDTDPNEADVASAACDSAVDRVSATIAASPRAWRHLGEPKDAVRELSEQSKIDSQAAYERALAEVTAPRITRPRWKIRIAVDVMLDPALPNVVRVRVLLHNRTPWREEHAPTKQGERGALVEPDVLLQERAVFNAKVEVRLENGTLVPFDFLQAPSDYRSKPQMAAKGINCVAVRDHSDPQRLFTETLPVFRQPHYRTRDDLSTPFEALCGDEYVETLDRIDRAMVAYLEAWDAFLASEGEARLSADGLRACRTDRDRFQEEISRFRLGMQALKKDTRLAKAFRLMNTAFSRLSKASRGPVRGWRLFQIGFIISQLPSLAVREQTASDDDTYSEQLHAAHDEVGILWFPTGGGKTEAYLGIIGVALLFDRLRGKPRGVCAWMRFPLRMLSLQQLDRLARVLAALEVLRSQTIELQTGDAFAIGYFVGDGVTPNTLSDEDMRKLEHDARYRDQKRLIRRCPFCGSAVEVRAQRKDWRLTHVCTNLECFTHTSDSLGPYKGSLPVCIVDNEIYRYLPSVLVGTVDKLAIVGRNRHFAHLVNGVRQRCHLHGYTSYDECIERWSGCKLTKSKLEKLAPIRDPGLSLVIQDELHLLRAELGVFNGHYEGLLHFLGAKAYMSPKILAATATIEAYDVHAFHLYLSRARRFPQPSWTEGESFYATSTPYRERRYYVGVRAHTRAVEDPIIRITYLYQRAVRRLKGDPRLAASILARSDLADEEIQDILRLYDLSLVYVNRKATGGSVFDKLSRAERQLETEGLGDIHRRLLTGDQTIEDVGTAIDQIERERHETGEPRLDVVIATNLISHGVDLERINMMAVAGMPSHYAEYVQATSRAARSHPGLVFVCFLSRDPRENSQYEFFPAMHENMDRLIEAVAVNRFASFAPMKTVPGLLAGLLLCALSPSLFAARKIAKPLDHLPTLKIALGIAPATSATESGVVSEDYLRSSLLEIVGADRVRPPASPSQIENAKRQVELALDDNLGRVGRGLDTQLKNVINPLTSFRDVDEGIDFGSINSASLVTRLRAH